MSIEAMKQALEALELVVVDVKTTPNAYEAQRQAITSLRQAIEQVEGRKHEFVCGECVKCGASIEKQEPVAWQWLNTAHFRKRLPKDAEKGAWNPLYAASRREWVGLTPADFDNLEQLFGNKVSNDFVFADIVCVISAKLKEKNT